MGKEFLNLMDPDEVKKIIDSLNMERKIERINLSDAYQRVLAEDVHALIDLPPFNRASWMDMQYRHRTLSEPQKKIL
jgi:molybdopterin molybdotransferase